MGTHGQTWASECLRNCTPAPGHVSDWLESQLTDSAHVSSMSHKTGTLSKRFQQQREFTASCNRRSADTFRNLHLSVSLPQCRCHSFVVQTSVPSCWQQGQSSFKLIPTSSSNSARRGPCSSWLQQNNPVTFLAPATLKFQRSGAGQEEPC